MITALFFLVNPAVSQIELISNGNFESGGTLSCGYSDPNAIPAYSWLNAIHRNELYDAGTYDLLGNIILQKLSTQETNLTIDISNHAQGIYYVKAVSSEGEIVGIKKVVVR